MSPNPLISVLLPVKNGGPYLQIAVTSILKQSQQNLELIVVDDHSEDGAVTALEDHPKLIRLNNNGHGVSAATNMAAHYAGGTFLARMDADDIALPERLQTQLDFLAQHPDIGLCGTEVDIFTNTGSAAGGYSRYQQWINALHTPAEIAANLFVESPIPNPTVMFRKQVFEQLGGFHNPVWHEDYDLYLRAHFAGIKMGKPEGVLLRWRDHEARSTRNQSRYLQSQLLACKAHYLAAHVIGDRPVLICGTGPVGVALHDALEKVGVHVNGFLDIAESKTGASKRGKAVSRYNQVAAKQQALYLGALGKPAARQGLLAFFQQKNMQAWRDYVTCA